MTVRDDVQTLRAAVLMARDGDRDGAVALMVRLLGISEGQATEMLMIALSVDPAAYAGRI